MELYSVRLNNNSEVYFYEYNSAKRFVKDLDFKSRYSISCDNSIDYEDYPERHVIEKIEIPDIKRYNYIYGWITMNLNKKDYSYQMEIHPIKLEEELKTRGNYSIIRRNKEGDLKSVSCIFIEEQGFMEVELYIPIGIYTDYITGKVIKERLIKQIKKYRNNYFSKKLGI